MAERTSGTGPTVSLGWPPACAFIQHIGPVATEVEVIRGGINVLQIPPPLPVAGLFDRPFEFAKLAFLVVHGRLDTGIGV
jgi:hypothetical protein